MRKLRWHGIRVGAVSLEPPFASIDALAAQLDREIEDFLQAGATSGKLVLVTHSMGGLAARAYLKRHGAARVAKLITLACPHHGTRLAYLGLGHNAREMRPGSAWLCTLAEGEAISGALHQRLERARQFRRPAGFKPLGRMRGNRAGGPRPSVFRFLPAGAEGPAPGGGPDRRPRAAHAPPISVVCTY